MEESNDDVNASLKSKRTVNEELQNVKVLKESQVVMTPLHIPYDEAAGIKDSTISSSSTTNNSSTNDNITWPSPWHSASILSSILSQTPRLLGGGDDDYETSHQKPLGNTPKSSQKSLADETERSTISIANFFEGVKEFSTTTQYDASQNDDRKSFDVLLKERMDKMRFNLVNSLADGILDYAFKDESNKTSSAYIDQDSNSTDEVIKETMQSPSTSSVDDYRIDDDQMKGLNLYKKVLTAVKYQRDNYIMGQEYATECRVENQQMAMIELETGRHDFSTPSSSLEDRKMETYHGNLNKIQIAYPPPTQTLAFHQLTNISQRFIPSSTMQNAIHPIVLWSISKPQEQTLPEGGPLRRVAFRALKDVIPLSQSSVDDVVKQSILQVLKNKTLKNQIKDSTGSYMSNMQRDKDQRSTNEESTMDSRGRGNFVITKTQSY